MKKISVLLPSYNSAAFIKVAIASILKQTFQNFTLLIIDDGSTDNTEEIVKSFYDERIIYIKKAHTGLTDTLNYGLKVAETEIIARMDADDIALPYRLQKQYNFLQQEKNYDVISSWFAIFDNNKVKFVIKTSNNSAVIKKKLLLYSEICHPASLIKRNKILSLGGYGSLNEIDAFDDYELWLRGKDILNFYNIPEVLLFQRYRKDSLSRDNIKDKIRLHYNIQEFYYQSDEMLKFGIKDNTEELSFRGWREYFYGNKNQARFYWKKLRHNFFLDYRVIFAYILTFLPDTILIKFKELRVRFRLNYILHFFSSENVKLRKAFKKLINETS